MSDRDFSNLVPGSDRPRGRRGQRRSGDRQQSVREPEPESGEQAAGTTHQTREREREQEYEDATLEKEDEAVQDTEDAGTPSTTPGAGSGQDEPQEMGEGYGGPTSTPHTDGGSSAVDEGAASAPSGATPSNGNAGPRQQLQETTEGQPAQQPSLSPAAANSGSRGSAKRGERGSNRDLPEGRNSPMSGRTEQVIPSHYTLPESHTIVVDEIRALLRRPPYRYTKRQASQSNVVALAIERLYEDVTGERMPHYGTEQDDGSSY